MDYKNVCDVQAIHGKLKNDRICADTLSWEGTTPAPASHQY
jgi:hypothetical protein